MEEQMTTGDRRRIIEILETLGLSNRETARRTGFSEKTVRDIRREVAENETREAVREATLPDSPPSWKGKILDFACATRGCPKAGTCARATAKKDGWPKCMWTMEVCLNKPKSPCAWYIDYYGND